MKVVTKKYLLYFCCQISITVDNFGPNQSIRKTKLVVFLCKVHAQKNPPAGRANLKVVLKRI